MPDKNCVKSLLFDIGIVFFELRDERETEIVLL